MARTKETWEARIVPGSTRAEGKNQIAFNLQLVKDPDRVIRVTHTIREIEMAMTEMRREKERAAARDIFNLGM